MLAQDVVRQIFSQAQAIITGDHLVYAKKPDGWYHGYDYVNKDAIYPHVRSLSLLCRDIADHFLNHEIEVVVGPTIGAVCLAQWVAHRFLDYQHDVLAVYADEEDVLVPQEIDGNHPDVLNRAALAFMATGAVEVELNEETLCLKKIKYQMKTGTRRILKRGYDKLIVGKRCLIVEDVINSGATVAKTIKAVFDAGGIIAGVGCLCNRSGGKVNIATLGITELFSLLDLNMQMFKEEDCPICKERGVESVRTDLGKGKEFLARIGKK